VKQQLRESAATATRAQVSELQQDHSVASSGLPATVAAETVREAHEQLEVLLKENTVLSEQVSVLESERQKYVDLAKRRSDELATITASFNTATSALQRLKDAVVVLRAQKQFCEETIKEKVNQVTDLEVERERLVEEMRVQDNSMQALQTQVAEHKKFAQQLSERALAESEFLDRQSLLVSTRSRELKNELDQKEAMLDSLKDAHRALKLEHDKTRQDCEGMLKVSS
jgi:chromosome segregation ATPase